MHDHHVQDYPLSRKDFMYERRGPWPQPAPSHPMFMAAEVLHLPKRERKTWDKYAGRNYFKELITTLPRSIYRVTLGGESDVQDLSDDEFTMLITTTLCSKFMHPATKIELSTTFGEQLAGLKADSEYFIADYRPVQDIEPLPGVFVAPTLTLFERPRPDARFEAVAISIGHLEGEGWQHIVVRPDNANAWKLSKYYVMQGAAHMTTLAGHPATHFPYDAINAVTKTCLPTRHTLFKLLSPHLFMALAVNNAVLEGESSVVSQTRGEIYAPFAGSSSNVRQLVAAAYKGYPNILSKYEKKSTPDAHFPPYRFPTAAPENPTPYGDYVRAYYATVKDFVRAVVGVLVARRDTPLGREECYYTEKWADYIAPWTPGFPNAAQIFAPDANGEPNLVSALTTYIWDVSVEHSVEHANYYFIGSRRAPFRIRVPPPATVDITAVDRRDILTRVDLVRSDLAFNMFFKPHNVRLLKDVTYNFVTAELQQAERDFLLALAATEARMIEQGLPVEQYGGLGGMATSIQY